MPLALLLALLQAAPPAAEYLLGPDDEVVVRALNVEEIPASPLRIDRRGDLNLPLVGRVHAAGLSTAQLEAALVERLKTYLHEPQVTVFVQQYRSQPVSVLGAVGTPGVHQIEGRRTLFEVLSLAGGLRPDAGHSIRITRRKEWGDIPLPGCAPDASGEYFVAELAVRSVLEARNPAENILVRPNDVISVARADAVYVIGSVRKPGGYLLGDKPRLSVLQALALAEGLDRTPAPGKARILRTNEQGARIEVAVDLKRILKGRASDVALNPNDVLFVPGNTAKSITARAAEAAIALGTGVIIYGRRY